MINFDPHSGQNSMTLHQFKWKKKQTISLSFIVYINVLAILMSETDVHTW